MHRTPHHTMREHISHKVQELLSNLTSPSELHSKIYRHKIHKILLESDPQHGRVFSGKSMKDFETYRMGPGLPAQRYIDAYHCHKPQKWSDLQDMRIGDEDLQLSLELLDNPYAKRWLVYPDQSLAADITQLWKDFFALECVQDVYVGVRKSNPLLTDLRHQIEKQRQLKHTHKEHAFNKAAL